MNPVNDSPRDSQASPVADIQHALSLQGALFGQHDEMLRSVVERHATFLKQVSVLTTSLLDLSTQLAPPVVSPPVTATAGPSLAGVASSVAIRGPVVPLPERYMGDTGAGQAFLVQCSLVFDPFIYPLQSYSSERSRIAYVSQLTF